MPRLSVARLAGPTLLALPALILAAAHCGSDSAKSGACDAVDCGAAGTAAAGAGGGTAGSGGEAGSAVAGSGGSAGDAGSAGSVGGENGPLTLTAFDDVRITSNGAGPNFQQANAEFELPAGTYAEAKLIVDLRSTCFPFENWKTNPPPPGQYWPADCDAFDRNFEFTLDEPKQEGGSPAIELLRAITPFGGPLHAEVDITDVVNGLPGAHSLRVTIPTWSDGEGKVSGSNGGWNVSAKIVAQKGPAPRKVLAVKPLVNWSHTADAVSPVVPFTVPDGTTSAHIEYRVTGHGGGAIKGNCSGPAEEFCMRKHALSIDGEKASQFLAWRTDCSLLCTLVKNTSGVGPAQYCAENPCGAVSSVEAPRANWCPGSETPPKVVSSELLTTAGAHDFSYSISTIEQGGSWRVSAVFFAFGD